MRSFPETDIDPASLGRARPSSAPPPKRKKTSVPFVVKETWTHEFFCLADHLQNKLPSRTDLGFAFLCAQ